MQGAQEKIRREQGEWTKIRREQGARTPPLRVSEMCLVATLSATYCQTWTLKYDGIPGYHVQRPFPFWKMNDNLLLSIHGTL